MREEILAMLRKEEDYLSGEKMSRGLDVSRTMVWKVIKGLREEGYQIESITNKGYKLTYSPDLVTSEEIKSVLKTKYFGNKIFDYIEVGSTSEIAKAKAREGAPEGTVFIAESQTEGRGRLGKTWDSPKGTGIWMSIILRPQILPQEVPSITLIAGLAICQAIREITKLPAYIKWPNDIVVGGKKVCGILTEMSAEIDLVNYVIMGIGINVNTTEFPEELEAIGTSLKIEGGKAYARKDILGKVLLLFEDYYEEYTKEASLLSVLEEYKALCVTLKNDIKITNKNETYWATPLDMDETGALIIKKQDGTQETIRSGEVSVRGIYGYV